LTHVFFLFQLAVGNSPWRCYLKKVTARLKLRAKILP
jgi:hypothetical protein